MEGNGKVNGVPPPGAGASQSEQHRVEVFRLTRRDQVAHVRMLHPKYDGLFTHYFKQRSRYCDGDMCNPMYHRVDKVWKGYASCEVWTPEKNAWYPWVLELTEHLEVEMRPFYARGQVWEIYHDPESTSANPAVTGKWHEDLDPATLPPPFDYMPVLFQLYHTTNVRVGIPNPMPPRVLLKPSAGAPPKVITESANKVVTYEEELARLREAAMKNRKSPTQNGRGHK